MPRLSGESVKRIHVLLYEKDIRDLQLLYGTHPGVGPAVRAIVRQFLKRLDSKLEALPEEEKV